ncbi:DUF6406 domain-containing protein [Streptomonospora nanhaiensis]|uniref:Lipoprotein n=1 Tax=Streptomonospora nanhaiensis TaxID=1323731 RepID=A0A853BT96_9ACTN|nr:DUF6406 domain-containing protein [Streptomonospora nanhaiensis]MBV2363563.1 hypothetical protein [Streptomonospora nanhaiensis]MBX9390251.1 hypothetical protein [Streptomonospora nanhaiensis]NYI98578.1 hypothetical protein [Streptomonospora nanhaiensis]
MTEFVAARRVRRTLLAAALGAAVLLGAAACAQGGEPEPEASSPAPVLGVDDDRVQLLEGTPASVEGGSGDPVELQLTGYEDGEEPAVVISARPEGGEAEEFTLRLGEHLDAAGSSWRVSEIGISGSANQPASVTLTREAA